MQTQPETTNTFTTPGARRGRLLPLIAVIAVAAIGVAVFTGGAEPAANPSALELSLGESGALASCLVFDVAILADMPVAFQGTVTSVDGSTVTLAVDRWFRGGDAATVTLVGEDQSPALIAGFEFTPGGQYLITATEGTVNYCGYSGAVTPELLAGYEAAFAG